MKKSILFLLGVLVAGAPVVSAMEEIQQYSSDSSSAESSVDDESLWSAGDDLDQAQGSTHQEEDHDVKGAVFKELDQDESEDADDESEESDVVVYGSEDESYEEADDRKGNYFDMEEGKEKLEQCYLILHHVLPQLLGQAALLGIPIGQFEDIIGQDLEDIDPKKVAKFLKKCHLKLTKEFGEKIFSKLKKRPRRGGTRTNFDVKKIVTITENIIDQFIHVYTKIKLAKKGQKRSMVTETNVQAMAHFSLVLLDVFKKGLEIKMNDATLTDEERGIFKRWYNKFLAVGVVSATVLGVGSMMGWCNIASSLPLLSQYLPEAMTCAVGS